MQRVTNCILIDEEQKKVLLLQKPRRGWWVAPGGKMEACETVTESVMREYKEETGIQLINPQLKGVFSILVEDNGKLVDEWMMFTFLAHQFEGDLLKESPEGELAWIDLDQVLTLPKAAGDDVFFKHLLFTKEKEILIHKFRYTPEYQLLGFE